ncbi:hypothetical protein [Paenibacillus larvae]|uniref:hypothetical protein n=1 Tax=Paenibacillus larvae TaxID=1464 RepID=UPI0028902CC1|nr:hypothetical protein [Paenibacillus larvae]MDT2193623.1 hypothetical protein [Paenibacillus larvae]
MGLFQVHSFLIVDTYIFPTWMGYTLTSSVPKNGLSSIVSKMNKDGAIIFTDQDGAARGKDTKGAYDKESKSLWVQINHEGHNLEKDADRKTLFHEFGRAQDELLFKNQSKKKTFKRYMR